MSKNLGRADNAFEKHTQRTSNATCQTYGTEDQWSESDRTLKSRAYQQKLGAICHAWKDEEDDIVSNDDLMDALINEINLSSEVDLFDYNKVYLDPELTNIIDELREDTRHQIGRLLWKGKNRPKRRLQGSLVRFYMWVDLAIKCREARKARQRNPTRN